MSSPQRYKIIKHEERGPRGGIRLVGYALLDTSTNIVVRRRPRRGELIHERDRMNATPRD
jgi:hypothetical protein